MTPEQRAALVEKADKRIAELLGEDSTAINRPRHMLTIEVIDLIRNEVLEEAAKVADEEANRHWDNGHGFRDGTALHIANAIRALKEGK